MGGTETVAGAAECREWQPLAGPEVCQYLPSVYDFYISHEEGSRRLVILLPDLDDGSLGGGLDTVLRFAVELAASGCPILCLSLLTEPMSRECFAQYLREELGVAPELTELFDLGDARKGYLLRLGDHVMATGALTLPLATSLAKRCGRAQAACFIQDIEPLFAHRGLEQAWLMAAYGQEYLPIINSSPVAKMLFALGADSFATSVYRAKALVFEPAVDRSLFYAQANKNPKKIIFVCAPCHSQAVTSMSELALEAISRLARDELLDPEEWEAHCYGCPNQPPFAFEGGMRTVMLPKLPRIQYAAEIRRASLGLYFALSPHTGYTPLQLAACGVPVITNVCMSKTAEALRRLSPGIYPVKPTFDAVTSRLRNIILEGAYKKPAQEVKPVCRAPRAWREAFAPIMGSFSKWCNS